MEKLASMPFIARRKMEQFTATDSDIQICQKPTTLPKSGSNPNSDNSKILLAISYDSVYNGGSLLYPQHTEKIDVRLEHQAYA